MDDLFSLNQLKLITNLEESLIIYDPILHSTQTVIKSQENMSAVISIHLEYLYYILQYSTNDLILKTAK